MGCAGPQADPRSAPYLAAGAGDRAGHRLRRRDVCDVAGHGAIPGGDQTAYYERYRFADIFAEVKRAPERLGREIASIPGVARVETRDCRHGHARRRRHGGARPRAADLDARAPSAGSERPASSHGAQRPARQSPARSSSTRPSPRRMACARAIASMPSSMAASAGWMWSASRCRRNISIRWAPAR